MADHAIGVPGAAWGLVGVLIGWALNAITEWIRRHTQRKDKARDLETQRGEELVEQCHQAFEWMVEARRVALQENRDIPVQVPAMRAAAIVEIYYQGLHDRAVAVDTASQKYRSVLTEISSNRMRGVATTRELNEQLARLAEGLMTAIGLLLHDAREAVRAKVG
jgi:uncharacterized protein (DUF2342 family)